MSAWLDGQLKDLGVTTQLVDLGEHKMDGQTYPLPPAILGRLGNDPKKKTVLIYGHYDVQPVSVQFESLGEYRVPVAGNKASTWGRRQPDPADGFEDTGVGVKAVWIYGMNRHREDRPGFVLGCYSSPPIHTSRQPVQPRLS